MKLKSTPRASNVNVPPVVSKSARMIKTMNVKKDDDGEIVLESEDHSISFSFNRQITPEDKNKESTNKMISDVMGTPRSKKQMAINDMD